MHKPVPVHFNIGAWQFIAAVLPFQLEMLWSELLKLLGMRHVLAYRRCHCKRRLFCHLMLPEQVSSSALPCACYTAYMHHFCNVEDVA